LAIKGSSREFAPAKNAKSGNLRNFVLAKNEVIHEGLFQKFRVFFTRESFFRETIQTLIIIIYKPSWQSKHPHPNQPALLDDL